MLCCKAFGAPRWKACPKDSQHRQAKYLNNIIEADHGKSSSSCFGRARFQIDEDGLRDDKGFEVTGFEVMLALRKGRTAIFNLTRDIFGEAHLVERAFDLGARALAEVVQLVGERLEAA